MARMEASVVIKRPLEEVFAYVTDVGSWVKWHTGLVEAEQTSEGPVGVGTTCRGVSEFLGRRDEWTSEVTAFEPNEKVEQQMVWGPMKIAQTLTFEPVDDGTRFTLAGEGETGGIFKMAEPIVNRMMKKQGEANLANLKRILEG
jgi:uncharacterized protein YndB with AHSA1/START domain